MTQFVIKVALCSFLLTSTLPAQPFSSLPNSLLDGTPVKLKLAENVTSASARVGQNISFEVIEEVAVNGLTIIPKGSAALATVTVAEPKRRMGRGGKLDMNIDSVRLADGEKAALRAVSGGKGGGHTGAMTGAIVATSLVLWPAAPFFLFMHGKDIAIPKGTEITAYVQGDMHLDMAKFGGQSASLTPRTVVLSSSTQSSSGQVSPAGQNSSITAASAQPVLVPAVIKTVAVAPRVDTNKTTADSGASASASTELMIRDVLKMQYAGVSEDIILQHLKAQGRTYDLSTDQIIHLRTAGVRDAVIKALMAP